MYQTLRYIFWAYLRIFHLLRVRGQQHIPVSGPVILCANHTSYFDSMLLGLCTRRPVHFLIYHSFYNHPLLGWFVRRCGAIAVTQNGIDKQAMGQALAVLRQEGIIGVFPEGKLSVTGRPNGGKPGMALLAAASGAPLVPVTISGAHAVFGKGRKRPSPGTILVEVHGPVHVEPSKRKDKQYLQAVTDQVMGRIGRRLAAYWRMRHSRRRSDASRG